MEILLDPSIRDWVLIPIVLATFLAAVLRNIIGQNMPEQQNPSSDEVKVQQAILRVNRLKSACGIVSEKAFKLRRSYFCRPQTGFLHKEFENTAMNMMFDPGAMMAGMKRNMVYGVSSMLLLTWVGNFFSGFILARVPFPLTQKFRVMLQRGVELNALDVTYVSSSSWYFLVLFGISGLLNLILGDRRDPNEKLSNLAAPMMAMGGGGGKDLNKITMAERENLDLVRYSSTLSGVEKRYLERFAR